MVIFKNGRIVAADKQFLKSINESLGTLSYLLNIIELQIADLKREKISLKGEEFQVKRVDLLTLENLEVFELEPVAVQQGQWRGGVSAGTQRATGLELGVKGENLIPILRREYTRFAIKIDGKIVQERQPAPSKQETAPVEKGESELAKLSGVGVATAVGGVAATQLLKDEKSRALAETPTTPEEVPTERGETPKGAP
ncbi:MAG: hypothetical protein ABGW77_03190, partial [Campylobacterales bacterium]